MPKMSAMTMITMRIHTIASKLMTPADAEKIHESRLHALVVHCQCEQCCAVVENANRNHIPHTGVQESLNDVLVCSASRLVFTSTLVPLLILR